MSIPDEVIEAIRARADIAAVVSRYVTLKKRGRSFVGLCPFHAEKTPSFSVFPERNSWHCFGCGAGGNVFTFLMRIDGLTFPEAVERLGRETGIEVQRDPESQARRGLRQQVFDVNKAAAEFFSAQLQSNAVAQAFVRRRGLTPETVQALGLGYAPEAWDALASTLLRRGFPGPLLEQAGLARPRESGSYYDLFRHRLIFPIRDVEGRVVAFGGRALGDVQPKYLNSAETPVFDKGRTLYGLDQARRAIAAGGEAIVVEGYMDAAIAQQAGVENVVATLGTALGPNHLQLLRRYAPRVVLAYDGDAAGAAAAERSLALFEDAEMEGRILVLPAGRDPDEFIREQGAEAFRDAARQALPLVEFQLRRLTERAEHATPEGRAALAQAVAPVLAGIRSPVKREEYVRRLAEEWCAGQLYRVRDMEEAIRREVRRSGSSARPAGPRGAPPRDGPPGEPAASSAEPVLPPRVVGTERCVLQGLLGRLIPGSAVLETIAPADFQVPGHRRVAELFWQYHETDEPIRRILEVVGADDALVSSVISGLVAEQEKRPVTTKMVEESVNAIKERRLKARIAELQSQLARPDLPASEERTRMEKELRELVKELSDRRAG